MQQFAADPRWIIDGNSPGSLPIRLARAHVALWCRPPRHVSLSGVLRRWWRYRGQVRPEMAPGCPERLTREFLRYVWSFESKEVPQFMEVLSKHGQHVPVLTLRSYREGEKLLASLGVDT
jgi:adenylate kinase family enzyme